MCHKWLHNKSTTNRAKQEAQTKKTGQCTVIVLQRINFKYLAHRAPKVRGLWLQKITDIRTLHTVAQVLPTHLHVSEMTCDACGWHEVCIRMCESEGSGIPALFIFYWARSEGNWRKAAKVSRAWRRKSTNALRANCTCMCVSRLDPNTLPDGCRRYCHSKPHFFIAALENANVILKKYEASACFTLAGPLEQ